MVDLPSIFMCVTFSEEVDVFTKTSQPVLKADQKEGKMQKWIICGSVAIALAIMMWRTEVTVFPNLGQPIGGMFELTLPWSDQPWISIKWQNQHNS